SLAEMREAFNMIGGGRVGTRKFCIFIDGLDEYAGNYVDGVTFVRTLVANPNVKIVVSSRPVPACVQAFSNKPQLQLQDLTEGDITEYVNDTIGSHPHMEILSKSDPVGTNRIQRDIGEKASGVFLWVCLVCHSLLESFACYDSVSELQYLVDELPREIEDLFQHMLSRIKPRYQEEAAKLLLICYQSQLASEDNRVYTASLAIANEYGFDLARMREPRGLAREEGAAKCQILEGRLRSRCCGLLEIN
ncbi:hypothetical protein K458DRAFT_277886, partial [Lentithecium fluviatile CBS 122367]